MITINLLPEEIRENIVYSKKNLVVLKYIKVVIIACILFLSSFTILYFAISASNALFKKQMKESDVVIQKDQKFLDDAKSIQARTQIVEKIKKDYKYWSKLDYILNRITPAGIKVSSLEFEDKNMSTVADVTKKTTNTKNSKMKITGYSKTKNDVGLFRDILAAQNGFKMVNIDDIKEDNSVNGASNSFTISFILEDSAIKKEAKK